MYELYSYWFHLKENIVHSFTEPKHKRLLELERQIAEKQCETALDYAIKVLIVHDNADLEMPPIERSLVRDALTVLANVHEDQAEKDEDAPA